MNAIARALQDLAGVLADLGCMHPIEVRLAPGDFEKARDTLNGYTRPPLTNQTASTDLHVAPWSTTPASEGEAFELKLPSLDVRVTALIESTSVPHLREKATRSEALLNVAEEHNARLVQERDLARRDFLSTVNALRAAEAEVARLSELLARRDVQWGACEPCQEYEVCPICGARRIEKNDAGLEVPGAHGPMCEIGQALARR